MNATSFFLMLDTRDVVDHSRIRRMLTETKAKGFDSINFEFRNSMYDMYSDTGKAAVRAVVNMSKELGLKSVILFEHPGVPLLEKYPQARQKWLIEHRAQVIARAFSLDLIQPGPPDFSTTSAVFQGIRRAFFVKRQAGAISECEDVTDQIGWAFHNANTPRITGTYESEGELLLYAEYEINRPDYAFPYIREGLEMMLDICAGCEPDGIILDEFGIGTRKEDIYMGGEWFCRRFEERFGYDFRSRLFLLKNEAEGYCAALTRYHYYKLSCELTGEIQRQANEMFKERYPWCRFTGCHHTWWGEGNSGDLWAGNMDYFSLARNICGGMTDSQFYSESTMTSMISLAESLAKYAGGKEIYSCSWTRDPTPMQLEYYSSLLGSRNCRWTYIGWGCALGFSPGYPDHYTWDGLENHLKNQYEMLDFIKTAEKKPKVALMYCWESAAAQNNRFMHYHRLSLKAVLRECMTSHIEIDVVPTFAENLDDYETLIVLWPELLPEDAWSAIRQYVRSGKDVIFMGPPARYTAEGRDVSAEFRALVGAGAISRGEIYPEEYAYDFRDVWFTPEKVDMLCYPMEPAGGRPLIVHGDKCMGIQNGNVKYYPFEIALTPCFGAVMGRLSAFAHINAEQSFISKLMYDGEDAVLTLCARLGQFIDARFEFLDQTVEIRRGKLIGLRFSAGVLKEAVSRRGAVIRVNGKEREYKIIGA